MIVVVSLAAFGIELTNIAISVVTLLMVFVLLNTPEPRLRRPASEARRDRARRRGLATTCAGSSPGSEPEIRELSNEDDTVSVGSEWRK